MPNRIKKVISLLVIIILSILSYLLLTYSVDTMVNTFKIRDETYSTYAEYKALLEKEVWRRNIEKKYMEDYCNVKNKVPSPTNSSIIEVSVTKYDKPLLISSFMNPYPDETSLYELGFVTTSNSEEINEAGSEMKLYRIVLNKDPKTFIEYISHTDNPHIYIIKNTYHNNFLLYPILKYVNSEYYINIVKK